jgi:hypothetical protein
MYDQLKTRLAAMLARPRALKPQTERQITSYLAEHSSTLPAFLLCAADVLEDYEVDIVFGPLFTPTLDERAEISELLVRWQPSGEQLEKLVRELRAELEHLTILLPDGTEAKLTLHEVMIERFVRLLRLDCQPDNKSAESLQDTLPPALRPVALALLSQRGMTPDHQKWFAAFIAHMSGRRVVSRPLLETAAEFIASQSSLDPVAVSEAAAALMRATQGTAAYAAAGHTYWSPDVAQHHQYRGEGKVDSHRLDERNAEVERVAALVEDLRTFEVEP